MEISELLLDFRITSRCHLSCNLCFRNPGISDQPLENILKVIAKLSKSGFRRIGITGGEPTTREDYIDIIGYAKQLGFLTYLSTVGHKFIDHLALLEPILDWVGLPLDGVCYKTNAAVRSASMGDQHEVIKSIFNSLSQKPTTIRVKLTTVVSKVNVYDLNDIVLFVKKLHCNFAIWRFYQFCPLGIGKADRKNLEIPTELFLEQMTILKERHRNVPISWATFKERDQANIVMEPNFDIIIPEGEEYTCLGNIQRDNYLSIIASIVNRQDVLSKCLANRYWLGDSTDEQQAGVPA